MKIAILGKHESPATQYVLDELPEDKMTDYNWMRSVCQAWLYDNWDRHIDLYVEGFTPMTLAFLREWEELRSHDYIMNSSFDITLTLHHYQPKTGEYRPQVWRA
tara:strand:+ start:19 stop:330 length:312 start_codon:yes stop_codon:yes gene_type:complete